MQIRLIFAWRKILRLRGGLLHGVMSLLSAETAAPGLTRSTAAPVHLS